MFVEAHIEHVKIQYLGSGPYTPEALHVILNRQRTDRTMATLAFGYYQAPKHPI